MSKTSSVASKCLCPPGDGVYTVNTAKEIKQSVQEKIYQTKDSSRIKQKWLESLSDFSENDVCLLGVCSDAGGGILRGANWGPLFIREALLKGQKEDYLDLGDVRVIPHYLYDKLLSEQAKKSSRMALYQNENESLPVAPLSITEEFCSQFYSEFPHKKIFGLGGDHSVSHPLVKSYLEAKKKQGKNPGLLHFDAHTDLLEERLGVEICFGSWTYQILQFLSSPGNVAQVGIRSSGKDRGHWEKKYGVKQYWAQDVIKGAEDVAQSIIAQFKAQNCNEIYVSFDIDAVDREYVSATGTPEPEGPPPHDLMTILKLVAKEFPVTGADVVEFAPFINYNFGKNNEPQSTLMVTEQFSRTLIQLLNCN